MNGNFRWTLAAVVLCALCFMVTRFALRAKPVPRPEETIQPFTLETDLTLFQNKPAGEPWGHQTVAVRSDGSVSDTQTVMGVIGFKAGETSRTVQFMDGRRITLYPSILAKNTWPIAPALAIQLLERRKLNPLQDCIEGDAPVGHTTLLGQPVAITTHNSDRLARKLTDWRAPGLGCESLMYRSYDKQPDDSFKLMVESKAVSLQLGEPDPSLFEVPPGYQEMKPSDVERIMAEKYHTSFPISDPKALEQVDKVYEGLLGRDTPDSPHGAGSR